MADVSDCNSSKDEAAVSTDEVINGTPSAHVSVDIPADPEQSRRRVLHRVPPQLRENKKHIFDPVVLSLGPYHHGRTPQFHLGEQLKDEARDIVCGATDKGFLLGKIRERVDEIRNFYGGGAADEYGDEELAEMMLRDACFILCYIEMIGGPNSEGFHSILLGGLGMSGALFAYRDFFMLENQIPLWLVKLLFSLAYDGDDRARESLCNYLSEEHFGDYRMTRLPWEDGDGEEEPLHLLEAIYRTSFAEEDEDSSEQREKSVGKCLTRKCGLGSANRLFRTVTDLKAKGIHFGPSSYCLKDIRFSSYGKLQLPMFMVTNNSKVFFSNIIAFEMSPGTPTDFGVTSYVNFMKTLIENAEDAKELREKGILCSLLESDEQVVRMFQGIDTYGFCNEDLFTDVKMRIEKHCKNKAKTWMAEFLHTYFRSPWTAIALFAAIFILSLTFLQTYYTINPIKSRH